MDSYVCAGGACCNRQSELDRDCETRHREVISRLRFTAPSSLITHKTCEGRKTMKLRRNVTKKRTERQTEGEAESSPPSSVRPEIKSVIAPLSDYTAVVLAT